ncbi:MAG TPA: hypothetical protein ENJ09_05400 [Planctomycetes bacterium]|nr:hypothetical protein [Planctomycetota bacterium]
MDVTFRAPTQSESESVRATVAPGRSAAEHAWLYRAPAGSVQLCGFEGDRLVAHAGLVTRTAIVQGREKRFGELVDLYGVRPGYEVLAARGLLEEHAGPKSHVVVTKTVEGGGEEKLFGRLLGFEVLRTEVELVREVAGDAPGEGEGAVRLERFDEQARWLFDRCAGEWLALTLRDDRFWNWRFVDRPGSPPILLGVRDAEGILRGVAVFAPDAMQVLDFLCPPVENEVGRRLFAALEAEARARGGRELRMRLPERSPWFEVAQERGWRIRPTGRLQMARSFNRRLDDLALRESFYATWADEALGG